MTPDPWTITPATVTGATGGVSYLSDTITVTGLEPGVSVYLTASFEGFVDGGNSLTGTYKTTTDVFVLTGNSFVMKVMGHAGYVPGETKVVTVGVHTFSGYGTTFQSGTMTTNTFSVTTKP